MSLPSVLGFSFTRVIVQTMARVRVVADAECCSDSVAEARKTDLLWN